MAVGVPFLMVAGSPLMNGVNRYLVDL